MGFRLLAAVFAVSLSAMGQTMTVQKLVAFLESSNKFISQGKMTDREVAKYLATVKLSERLDDRVIEDMQGAGTLGPKTLQALQELRDRTKDLAAGAPLVAEPKPELPPPPSALEQGAILDEVRQYALNYSKNLPDFICTQKTNRYAAQAPGIRRGTTAQSEPSWQHLDTLQMRLSYFEQKEDYKLVLVNNRYTTQDYKTLGGATSTGDFGSLMRYIFEARSQAHFEWDHWATLRNRRTLVFKYFVRQENSDWRINYDRRMEIVPAYSGMVYIDKKTHEVTRVTLQAEDLPAGFPVRKAETILDYDYTDISGHNFLLPLKAQTVMAADDYMTKNDTEFRLYRKYSSSSEIKFDTDEVPSLPEEATKEVRDPEVKPKDPVIKK